MEWSSLGLVYMLGLILKAECLQHLQEERLGRSALAPHPSKKAQQWASLTAGISLALPFPTPGERFNKCWPFPLAFS